MRRSELAEPADRLRAAPHTQRREPARPVQAAARRLCPVPAVVPVPPSLPSRRVPRAPLPPAGAGRRAAAAAAAAVPTIAGHQTSQMLASRRRGTCARSVIVVVVGLSSVALSRPHEEGCAIVSVDRLTATYNSRSFDRSIDHSRLLIGSKI